MRVWGPGPLIAVAWPKLNPRSAAAGSHDNKNLGGLLFFRPTSEVRKMRRIALRLFPALAAFLIGPLSGQPALAQAPTGPQGGPPSQQQQKPTAPETPAPGQQAPSSGVSISVDVPVVTLDVVAATQHGDLIPNLKKENFRVLDEGVPQAISNFAPTDAPITMVVLMQFSGNAYGWFAAYARYWADALFPNLQQKDWVALETFDDRKSTRLNCSHGYISYAVFCLKKKKKLACIFLSVLRGRAVGPLTAPRLTVTQGYNCAGEAIPLTAGRHLIASLRCRAKSYHCV